MNRVKITNALKNNTMIIVLVVVFIFFTARTGGSMILPQNINNLISQNAYVFILATGMLLCILTGGNIDLSVGSVVAFAGAICGNLIVTNKWGVFIVLFIVIAVGILIGSWQGFWIAYIRIPPFIVTLAGMLIFRGAANVVLQGRTLAPMPQEYLALFNGFVPDIFGGQGYNITCMAVGIIAVLILAAVTVVNYISRKKKGYETPPIPGTVAKVVLIGAAILWFMNSLARYKGIPNVLIWITVVILIYAYITSRTVVGRHFYAVGGNEKAAALSGINTNRVYFLAYANMGFMAAIAALVTVARLNSANPTAGTNYEMDAISSCFIGGASAYGGTGTVAGVIIGATLMGVINLGMFIMGVDANYQKVVKGLVLLAAVAFDVISKKRGV